MGSLTKLRCNRYCYLKDKCQSEQPASSLPLLCCQFEVPGVQRGNFMFTVQDSIEN
jgi:hypothetical protein